MKKLNCILLVDDNSADNEFHEMAIREAGVCDHIKVALDGEEALDYVTRSAEPSESYPRPDIIFLDINMPKMNGFEFLEEYNTLEEGVRSSLVVVMLTTSLNPDDEERAKKYGSLSGFLQKPLTAQTVRELMEKYF